MLFGYILIGPASAVIMAINYLINKWKTRIDDPPTAMMKYNTIITPEAGLNIQCQF